MKRHFSANTVQQVSRYNKKCNNRNAKGKKASKQQQKSGVKQHYKNNYLQLIAIKTKSTIQN